MLAKLYEAKCRDLIIPQHNEQEKRFFHVCSTRIDNRSIKLNEQGLGPESAAVLSKILMLNKDGFCHLDISNNNLTNKGVAKILEGVCAIDTLVSLDLGSNDITNEGNSLLFRALQGHPSLASLTIANHDRMHRNRMGTQACIELRELLQANDVLSMLNIADNRI